MDIRFVEQEDKYTTFEEEVQVAETYADVEIDNTEPAPKIKSNQRKWLFGLGAFTALASVIFYVFKN